METESAGAKNWPRKLRPMRKMAAFSSPLGRSLRRAWGAPAAAAKRRFAGDRRLADEAGPAALGVGGRGLTSAEAGHFGSLLSAARPAMASSTIRSGFAGLRRFFLRG